MLDLPDELLIDIFLSLNLETIFNIRRVCRRLMAVSKARSLWINLFGRLQEEVPGNWYRGNYEALDALEFERLVVRAVRLEKNWSSKSPVCAEPPKQFKLKGGYVRYLLPGGRWIISGLFDGSSRLVCTDLDGTAPAQFNLLRHPEARFRGDAQRIALHLETNSDALAFTIAVAYYWPASEWEDNACCSIWRVRLEDSERFSVSHLSLFPLVYPGDFGNDSFVMNRDVLLRGTDEPHTRVFEVFDYRNCSNHQLRRGLVVLPREGSLPHVHAIRIVSYARFLVVTDGVLQLFKIPELSDVPSTSLHSWSGLESPLWTYNYKPTLPRCYPAVTPPHLAFRNTKDSSFGLLIQADSMFLYVSFPQKVSNILDVREVVMDGQAEVTEGLVGFHRGVWYDSKAELLMPYLTTFEVPGNKRVARELAGSGMCGSNGPESLSFHLASYTRLHEATTGRSFNFDETSGRILIPTHRDHNTLILLEFA